MAYSPKGSDCSAGFEPNTSTYPKERLVKDFLPLRNKVRCRCDAYWTGIVFICPSELLKINHYKAPRDKMICILNCCKVIFGQ